MVSLYNKTVTLCGWSAKHTIRSLCLFWRETKQRPEHEILTRPEVGKATPVGELEEETQKRQLAKGDAEGQWAVDTGQQKRPVDMR